LLFLAPGTWHLTPAFAQQPIAPTSVSTFNVEILTPALTPVSQVSASVIGNGGSSTFYYWIVARYAAGNATPSAPGLVISAPNRLTGANYVRVSWNYVPNATGYDVLRTTAPQLPNGAATIAVALNVAVTTRNDTGGALLAYSLSTLKPRQLSLQLQAPYMDLLAATPPPVSSAGRARYYFDLAAGQMMISVNGAAYVPFGAGSGSGIKTLNALSSVDQFLTTGTTGLDFNIVDSIDTHVFNVPDASATARGVITTGAQVFDGNKTFLGDVVANSFSSTSADTSNGVGEMDCSTVSPTAGLDILCADQTSHAFQISNNGAAFSNILTVAGLPSTSWSAITAPSGALNLAMGANTSTFTNAGLWSYAGVMGALRFKSQGTAVVAGDFVPSGGWGNAASVAVISASSDQSFHITVTSAGAGQGLNPTIAFTFHDGTWTTAPIYTCTMETGGTGALSFFTPDNISATVLTLTYAGTPIVSLTYEVACNAWGH
jgi:hypothetical protein